MLSLSERHHSLDAMSRKFKTFKRTRYIDDTEHQVDAGAELEHQVDAGAEINPEKLPVILGDDGKWHRMSKEDVILDAIRLLNNEIESLRKQLSILINK